MKYIIDYIILVILNILDVISTVLVLDSGLGYEANPFMAYLFANLGIWAGIIVKFLFLGYVGYLIYSTFYKKGVEALGMTLVLKLMIIMYISSP